MFPSLYVDLKDEGGDQNYIDYMCTACPPAFCALQPYDGWA